LLLVVAGPGAAQTPPGQPAEQKPLNPTQEIAKEQAEGPALEAGPAKIRIGGYVGAHGIIDRPTAAAASAPASRRFHTPTPSAATSVKRD
jgi:hypothetical protein